MEDPSNCSDILQGLKAYVQGSYILCPPYRHNSACLIEGSGVIEDLHLDPPDVDALLHNTPQRV